MDLDQLNAGIKTLQLPVTPAQTRDPKVSILDADATMNFIIPNFRTVIGACARLEGSVKHAKSQFRQDTSSASSTPVPPASRDMICLHRERIYLAQSSENTASRDYVRDLVQQHCPSQSSISVGIDVVHVQKPFDLTAAKNLPAKLEGTRFTRINQISTEVHICDISYDAIDSNAIILEYIRLIERSPKYSSSPAMIQLQNSLVFEVDGAGNVSTFLEIRVFWATRSSVDVVIDLWEPCFFDYAMANYHGNRSAHTPRDVFQAAQGKCPFGTVTKTSDFYDAAHVPDNMQMVSGIEEFTKQPTRLFPFQRRSVKWLLNQEGVDFRDGELVKREFDTTWISRFLGEPLADYDGKQFYVNEYLAFVSTDAKAVYDHHLELKGGILAEEMGLGKTVELASLMSLHKREINDNVTQIYDNFTASHVRISGATLIIMPLAIMEQWKNEVAVNAPDMKVFEYEGTNKLRRLIATQKGKKKSDVDLNDVGDADIIDYLLGFDIVLVPYPVLAHEIHYANKPPERNMRYKKQYERVTCPLVQISWWRVCLDEAQMVESGVSNAATVARRVPRINAWAVSGTPVQKNVDTDLHGLLIFLRLDPWATRKSFWGLLNSRVEYFKSLFSTIAIRQTKDNVRDEIHLPAQHRYTVSIPMSLVEEENYQALLEEMYLDLKVDQHGNYNPTLGPLPDDAADKMRRWLVQLRQACVHPQIGQRNRSALGGGEGQVLKTASEVLELMHERNSASVRQDQRALYVSIATRAQLTMEHSKETAKGVEILEKHIKEVSGTIAELRAELEDIQKRQNISNILVEMSSAVSGLGETPDPPGFDDDAEDGDLGQFRKLATCKARLNDFLEVEHMFLFLMANGWHNLADEAKKSEENKNQVEPEEKEKQVSELEKKENMLYEEAKSRRKELLANTQATVFRSIETIQRRVEEQDFVEIPEVNSNIGRGGLETSTILEYLSIIDERLNDQANILDEWRESLVQLLQEPLLDSSEEESTGEELDDAAHKMEEAYHYVDMIRAVVNDREAMVSGLYSDRARAELGQVVLKATLGVSPSGEPVANTDLLKGLIAQRDKLATRANEKPLRELVSDTRAVIAKLNSNDNIRSRNEQILAESILKGLDKMYNDQLKALKQLQKEVNLFSSVTNQRIEFYRKVQQISDTVQQYDLELPKWKAFRPDLRRDPDIWIKTMADEEKRLNVKLAQSISKGRYLLHLKSTNSSADANELCVICQDPIEEGFVTVCGHIFCQACLQLWFREKKSCPTCKRRLTVYDMHRITYKPDDIRLQHHGRTKASSSAEKTEGPVIYKGLDAELLNKIKAQKLQKRYSSKIDAIIRHLLFIRDTEPTAKSVLYSQWKDTLVILEEALDQNGIRHASPSQHGLKNFKQDPTIEVFLLHAKSQSAGLTLVNASHVFLCEPLVNTGLELQVVSRIHRIGQTRETSVWLYTVRDSVEETVMTLSNRRRMEMMKAAAAEESDFELMLDAAASKGMEESVMSGMIDKVPGGGELVAESDLRECLFGNKRKRRLENGSEDAVAGPSRKRGGSPNDQMVE